MTNGRDIRRLKTQDRVYLIVAIILIGKLIQICETVETVRGRKMYKYETLVSTKFPFHWISFLKLIEEQRSLTRANLKMKNTNERKFVL